MTAVYYDPYDMQINLDPYPLFKRMRDETPVYYNEKYDFYAVSRASDVERALVERELFSSAKSDVLEFIKADVEFPSGILIFEDPPLHTIHRRLLSGVFTPRKMAALEPAVREFTVRALDAIEGTDRFDFVHDLGAQLAMRTIGMLLGIPEEDQQEIHEAVDAGIRTEEGQPIQDMSTLSGEMYAKYVDWRIEHPSDDLVTELLNAEFEDETGTTRRMTREEALNYVNILAGAGNETTAKLIGWAGRVLGDHPEQRHELADNPALIPAAVEELLRFEPPGPTVSRYVVADAEFDGGVVPAGSALVCLVGSANHDERRFTNPDVFDIHRESPGHLTFSMGAHYCLGAALARLEGRVALEEVLRRYRDWTVDESAAKLASTSTVRGWESLPAFV